VQRGQLAIFPPGDAREDWTILRAFSATIGKALPYDNLEQVRARLEQVNPTFARLDILPRFACTDQSGPDGAPGRLTGSAFRPYVLNYYQTDAISRASATMAECTATFAAPLAQAAE